MTILGPLSDMEYQDYCNRLVNKIFKLLPLKEENNPTLPIYIDSLLVELYGGRKIIIKFANNPEFLSLINSIEGLKMVSDKNVYRSKVFECLNVCNKLM